MPLGRAIMASRTTHTLASFPSAFLLPGLDTQQPPGTYRVDHDEESIEGVSWLAWRRVASFIHLPAVGTESAIQQMLPIDPAALDAAQEKDQKQP